MRDRMSVSAMVRIGLLAAVAAYFGLNPQTANAAKTTRKYAHGELTVHKLIKEDKAKYLQTAIRHFTKTGRGKNQGITADDKLPWYVPADAARFNDVGKLWIEQMAKDGKVSHCTAFYVGEDILVTDAHCLTDSGITSLSNSAKTHLAYFYQGFNGETPTDDDIKDYARYVNAYWYPADYAEDTCLATSAAGNDWAFLRVDGKKNNAGSYTLVSNVPFVGEKILGVGYPSDTADVYKPFYAEATLHQATDAVIQTDKGVLRDNITPKMLAEVKKTSLAMLATPQPKGAPGGFPIRGGSGGPIMLSEEALKKGANSGKERAVVGLVGWGFMRREGKPIAEEQPFLQCVFTPIVSDDMLQLQQLLRDKKYDDISVDEAASK